MSEQRIYRPATCALEERDGKAPVIVGYGAVFYDPADAGTEFEFWGVHERVMRGAFDRALREDDVRALVNHDANLVLGRVTAGTLRLTVDAKGLRYEADVPDTQAGRDVAASIRRGDVTGSSFAFRVTDEQWRKESGVEIREILGVELFDVSPVTFPAYAATTADVRDDLRARAEASRKVRLRLASYRARAVETDLG